MGGGEVGQRYFYLVVIIKEYTQSGNGRFLAYMMVKSAQPGEGFHSYLPSRAKLQLRGQIHSPYFSSTLYVLYGHHKMISAVLDICARQKVSCIKARKWFESPGKLNVYENLLSIGQHRYM
jgi:hypothetical protein